MNPQTKKFFNHHKFEWLSYDDISLQPRPSSFHPSQTSLKSRLGPNVSLNIPFISADMDTVTESSMAIAIAKEGGIGFLWKCDNLTQQVGWVEKVKHHYNGKVLNPKTIDQNETILAVKKKLEKYENRFSTLIVLNSDGEVTGLIGRNQMQFARDADRVAKVMKKNPTTLPRDFRDVNAAYRYMLEHKLPKLVIVNRSGMLRGLYCFSDVRSIVENETPMYNRDENGRLVVGASVGVGGDVIERAGTLLQSGCDAILVGSSKGDAKKVIDTCLLYTSDAADE